MLEIYALLDTFHIGILEFDGPGPIFDGTWDPIQTIVGPRTLLVLFITFYYQLTILIIFSFTKCFASG